MAVPCKLVLRLFQKPSNILLDNHKRKFRISWFVSKTLYLDVMPSSNSCYYCHKDERGNFYLRMNKVNLSYLEMNFLLFLPCLSLSTQTVFVFTFLLAHTSHVRPLGHFPTFHCSVPGYTQCYVSFILCPIFDVYVSLGL
jgi:hypothetical protein